MFLSRLCVVPRCHWSPGKSSLSSCPRFLVTLLRDLCNSECSHGQKQNSFLHSLLRSPFLFIFVGDDILYLHDCLFRDTGKCSEMRIIKIGKIDTVS